MYDMDERRRPSRVAHLEVDELPPSELPDSLPPRRTRARVNLQLRPAEQILRPVEERDMAAQYTNYMRAALDPNSGIGAYSLEWPNPPPPFPNQIPASSPHPPSARASSSGIRRAERVLQHGRKSAKENALRRIKRERD